MLGVGRLGVRLGVTRKKRVGTLTVKLGWRCHRKHFPKIHYRLFCVGTLPGMMAYCRTSVVLVLAAVG